MASCSTISGAVPSCAAGKIDSFTAAPASFTSFEMKSAPHWLFGWFVS